jgi:HlyD family secretion protein
LRDVEASVERARAELLQAERDLERITSLYQQGVLSVADYNKAQYNHDVARAQIKSAEASLARARQNLAYATITAPVSGIVVERAVDVGQTVAASLAAPKLFTIANDLSEMQILAPVDESDIGQIKEGQAVRFTVKTYPDRTFTGVVKQVRLQSTIEQNIVNYTVVISVKNEDGKLLPGMTATVEFVVASAADVLKVANAALRFRPSESLLAEARERLRKQFEERAAARGAAGNPGDGAAGGGQQGRPGTGAGEAHGASGANGAARGQRERSFLYYLDESGKLAMMPVRPGISDGQYTEVRGPFLEEGMQVIAGMSQATATPSTNPFQGTQQSGPPRPPGIF